ncbi:MAG: hydantoinase B/oxoprolinase family protein [Pseudomonadota bacterium]
MALGHDDLQEIRRQLVWDRLIALVEEQAQTLIRIAFSAAVRESGDLSAGVFDRRGRMVAQAVTGTPGHVNSMAISVEHFLARYPIDEMAQGDAYITNDPWLSVGHYHDVTVVSPAFHNGRPVALFANTIHIIDMGGRGFGPDARHVLEEGINIPIMPLARAGELNEDLLGLLRTNVRDPVEMEGDMLAQMGCNADGERRLSAMLTEFDLPDLEALSEDIISRSEATVRERIAALPDGRTDSTMVIDGYDEPVALKTAVIIKGDSLTVDYEGSPPASPYGINVVKNFTDAYTTFGVNCIIAPDVPCNAGSLAAIDVVAPEGSILNAQRPSPVSARHTVGQMLPDAVFGCLAPLLPDVVPAEGAGTMWNPMLTGGPTVADAADAGPPFNTILFNTGGTGARPGGDGLSTTAFPSGVKTVPVEVAETMVPLLIRRKEFRDGSGGAGARRGGLGQVLHIEGADEAPFSVAAMFERTNVPAKGRMGGADGAPGRAHLASGAALAPKGRQSVPRGDGLILELPGGGGHGDPFTRPPDAVARDVADDLITQEVARTAYGVALRPDGTVDPDETASLRASRPPPTPEGSH